MNLQNSLERFIRDNTKLEAIAKQDELTGLYNRRGFLDKVESILSDPAYSGKATVLCYVDMDNLKMINDKYGHDDGDYSLRTVADILRECFRDTDVLGRIGGDEFVVMAIIETDIDIAKIRERIERVTKSHNETAGKPYPIAMSAGIHKFTCRPDVDIYSILEIADGLLYEEKMEKKAKYGSYR